VGRLRRFYGRIFVILYGSFLTLNRAHLYDRQIQQLTQTEYPETQALLKVHGVGHITALTYVLTWEVSSASSEVVMLAVISDYDHERSQSGDRDPQLGITKAGNVYLRSLLIECANHILRPHGEDSALRKWGLLLASRGGKQAKNKAVVAVARKLAVLLHRIWTTQEPYIPFYSQAA
jgi:transposase